MVYKGFIKADAGTVAEKIFYVIMMIMLKNQRGYRYDADRTQNTKERKSDKVSVAVWKFVFCHIGADNGNLYEFSGGTFGCGL